MKLKRLTLLFLVFTLLLSLLASCGSCGKKDPPAQTGEGKTDDSDEIGDNFSLPIKKFDRAVTVLALEGASLTKGSSTDPDMINEALVERTRYVEETYDVTMIQNEVSDGADYNALMVSYSSGLHAYDLVAPHPTKFLASIMTSGLVQDMRSLNYFDFSGLWWNQSQLENFTVNGKLMFGVCDFNLNKRGFSTMLMNSVMYNSYYPNSDPYSMVFNGEWTMERMKDIVLSVYDDTGDSPTYGYITNEYGGSGAFYWGGETLLKPDGDGKLTFSYDLQKCSDIAKKLYDIAIGPQTLKVKWYNSNFATGDAWTTFSSGRALIIDFDLYFASLMKDLSFDTVFLPGPKLNDDQKNYLTNCGAGFVGVPTDASDADCAALILEAYNRHSYNYFRPVYFDSYMAYRVSNDPRDRQVLQLILDYTVYDLGYNLDANGATAGKATGLLNNVVYQNMSTNVASYIEQYEDTIRREFEQTLSEIY